MDHPSQIFRRILQQKARPALCRQGRDAVAPAPIPAAPRHAPTENPSQPPTPPMPSDANPPEPPAPARPVRGHALYSQVMRSHDRMGTRHL